MKNIVAKLFVASYMLVSSSAQESLPLESENNVSKISSILNISLHESTPRNPLLLPTRASVIEDMRIQGLKKLENTKFHFGSKNLIKKVPNLTKFLNGLRVRNGIFFVTSDDWNPILYCNQNDHIDGSISFKYSNSIFGVRTDMIIFEDSSLDYSSAPSIYKEVILSENCWAMTKRDDIFCFTYKNSGLSFKGFNDPAAFGSSKMLETRYPSAREMMPVLKELALILEGKAPAVYDLDLAREKLMAFNRAVKERDRRAEILSDIRAKKEEQRREEKRKLTPEYGIPGIFNFGIRENAELSEGKKWKDFDSYFASLALSPDKKVILPNPDRGVISPAWLKSIWKKGEIDVVSEQENGMIARLYTNEPGHDKTEVWLFVGYYQSQAVAMKELYLRRLQKTPGKPETWSWDDEIETLVVNPFRLGDYNLGKHGELGDFGGIIPSSDESSLFFINGNTVVGIVSIDPSYSVLSLAQQIDKRLESARKK